MSTYKPIHRCQYCSREFLRKSTYDRHVISCEILSKTPNERHLEDINRDDVPSVKQIYYVLLEIAERQLKIEKKLEIVDKWVENKKRKLSIISWLNDNLKPKFTFLEFLDKMCINRSHLELIFQHNHINGKIYILQEFLPLNKEDLIPIKSFDQKENALFIYNKEWQLMTPELFDKLLNSLQKKIMDEFVNYQNENMDKMRDENFTIEYIKNVQKVMGSKDSKEKITSRIRRELYKYLKMNLRNIVQVEFTF